MVTERQHAITSAGKLSRPFPAYQILRVFGHSVRYQGGRIAPNWMPFERRRWSIAAPGRQNSWSRPKFRKALRLIATACPEADPAPQTNVPCKPSELFYERSRQRTSLSMIIGDRRIAGTEVLQARLCFYSLNNEIFREFEISKRLRFWLRPVCSPCPSVWSAPLRRMSAR